MGEEDRVWSRADLIDELADISYKMTEVEKQIKSAMEAMGSVVKEQMEGTMPMSSALVELIMIDLRKTINDLERLKTELQKEYKELALEGEKNDPLFWCTR